MFEVIWLVAALEEMDEIFLAEDSQTQDLLVVIVKELNRRLESAPLTEGESRGGNKRLTFMQFLAVRFSVDEEKSVVSVNSVRRYGK